MDELVKEVCAKTGLPQDQARAATQVIIDALKAKLPAPVAGQIDAVLKGGDIADMAKGLGGFKL